MKWRYENFTKWSNRVEKWHKWFAWYPVSDANYRYWLCFVEQRYIHKGFLFFDWEYRTIKSEQEPV